MIREQAPAKINLFLHVGVKRADDFHPLQSLAVFTGMGDELSFAPSDTLSLMINGPFAAGLDGEGDNLVTRAGRALGDGGSTSRIVRWMCWNPWARSAFGSNGVVPASSS